MAGAGVQAFLRSLVTDVRSAIFKVGTASFGQSTSSSFVLSMRLIIVQKGDVELR